VIAHAVLPFISVLRFHHTRSLDLIGAEHIHNYILDLATCYSYGLQPTGRRGFLTKGDEWAVRAKR
jgi:hypothetical protein